MIQKQNDLLLKDLCARLPYGVKCCIYNFGEDTIRIKEDILWSVQGDNILTLKSYVEKGEAYMYHQIKPYLFPLSSMTEEQKKEISKKYNYYNPYQLCVEITNHREGYWDKDNSCDLQDYLWLEDLFNKNHFDYRGLIPMGLANDATGLNIY